MRGWKQILPLAALLLAALPVRAEESIVHHDLKATLDPATHHIRVTDRITSPPGPIFHLNAALKPTPATARKLVALGLRKTSSDVILARYQVKETASPLVLTFEGVIDHPVATASRALTGGVAHTPGTIGPRGVFLHGGSGWVPKFDAKWVTFTLKADLPPGWRSLAPGVMEDGAWRMEKPSDEVMLLAAPWTDYSRTTDAGVTAQALLLRPDPALAERYLDATEHYLALYSDLIGPYPYGKFTLAENFWESGFGMPSFTLLGSRVIRFPFILHSSYPHEILHNWWGNGVYVDYATGNWSEGLTAYLADHLIKETRGQGPNYRRDALARYADYVKADDDFPLSDFRGRHDAASQAVGYGKTMMTFHMLRRRLGDAVFIEGLRAFWRDFQFKRAGFNDLRLVFESVSGKNLVGFFQQWVERTGAPGLILSDVTAKPGRLTFTLAQTGDYDLDIPVAVHVMGEGTARWTTVRLTDRKQTFSLDIQGEPFLLEIDPRFDLFRRLDRVEIPPALSLAFGRDKPLLILPRNGSAAEIDGYRALAARWRGETLFDDRIDAPPGDRTVWILGTGNRFWKTTGEARGLKQETVVRVHLQPTPDAALVYLGGGDPAALPALARKLPHYGKYGFLTFRGEKNIAKGQWPVTESPLKKKWATGGKPLPLPPETRLTP